MSFFEFILKVLDILIWPSIILFALLLFRRPLGKLVPLLQRVRYKEFEADFSRDISILQKKAEGNLPENKGGNSLAQTTQEDLIKLSHLSSRAAVIEAWLEVESSASALAEKGGLNLPSARSMSPLRIGYELHHAGLLSKAQLEIYHQLRNLRNIAVHFQNLELKEEDVKDFINLSMRLAASLRAMPHSA